MTDRKERIERIGDLDRAFNSASQLVDYVDDKARHFEVPDGRGQDDHGATDAPSPRGGTPSEDVPHSRVDGLGTGGPVDPPGGREGGAPAKGGAPLGRHHVNASGFEAPEVAPHRGNDVWPDYAPPEPEEIDAETAAWMNAPMGPPRAEYPRPEGEPSYSPDDDDRALAWLEAEDKDETDSINYVISAAGGARRSLGRLLTAVRAEERARAATYAAEEIERAQVCSERVTPDYRLGFDEGTEHGKAQVEELRGEVVIDAWKNGYRAAVAACALAAETPASDRGDEYPWTNDDYRAGRRDAAVMVRRLATVTGNAE